MSRSANKINKLQKIDEKIIAMQKEREEILNSTHKKIGEAITNEWDSFDLPVILNVIKELKPKAVQLINGEQNETSSINNNPPANDRDSNNFNAQDTEESN